MIKFIFLFLSFFCSDNLQINESCFRLKGRKIFVLGQKLNIDNLNINYGLEENGDNVGKNNNIKDYGSVDTSLSIFGPKGQVACALTFSKEDKTDKLVSLNCFWMFMIGDDKSDRIEVLKQIRNKFLPCFDISRIDIVNGGEYSVKYKGAVEKFYLAPRVQNGIDLRYWSFYYSIK
jgi:hypothetical protein